MTTSRMADLIYNNAEPSNEEEQVFVYWFNKREMGYTYMEIVTRLEEIGVWDALDISKLTAALNAVILQDMDARSTELNIIKEDTEIH